VVASIDLAKVRDFPIPPEKKQSSFKVQPYAWLIPAFALLTFVVGYPIIKNVIASFTTESDGTSAFVGVHEYTALLSDPAFYHSVVLTIYWTVGVTALQFALGSIAALAADRNTWFVRRARSIIVVPWVLPGVVVANIWVVFYDDHGLVNSALTAIGLPTQQAWLANGKTALIAIIVAAAWKGFPFYFLLLLAGLQSVPFETREAARVDGASSAQTLVRVVLPQMRAIITTSLVLGVIATSNYFDGVYLMTGGGPSGATTTLPVFLYNTAFANFDFTKASALSVIILLIVLVPVVVRLIIGARRGLRT
jgi:multiple sugar transport system permease protein